ncbi:1,2-phenylacetyl-CoA epoxidase subunit PaaE [Nakamurella sp.]|uniref:1,2-phenylacetyl-CoA epoxidase subunit PaaE n=1 Tax=Nakamurella sp. TaxID=1869182 RepID=UPI003B3B5108
MTVTGNAAGPTAGTGTPRRPAVFHPLRVSAVDRLTEDAVAVTFDVPDRLRAEFAFEPGQHLSVRSPALGDGVRRSYSICAPATGGPLRIGVKRIAGGVFSGYVAERLRPGDTLDVMTPTGTFTTHLDPARSRRYVAVAAGSGITPVLSILATALEVEPDSTAALVYVNRRTSTIMFLEELEDLKNRFPARLQLIHVLGHEMTEVELLSGRLDVDRFDRILDTLLPVDEVDEWFLCGPLALTDTVRGVLVDRGVDPEHVHRELFHVGAVARRRTVTAAPPAAGARVTVILDGRSVDLTVPAGDSILDATLEMRADAPYSCRNAVCGTCRARVTQGRVAMDANYALEPDEVARGFVLTCQSHPVTDRVVVDFDS